MSFQVTTRVEGLAAVERKLKLLPDRMGRRGMKRALRVGGNIIRDAARVNARRVDDPQSPENIAKNIVTQGMSVKRERQVKAVGVRVGVLGGSKSRKRGGGRYATGGDKSNPGGDTWYWRLLEFGTSKMRAQPIMRPAAASSASAVFPAVAAAAVVELDKELAKL